MLAEPVKSTSLIGICNSASKTPEVSGLAGSPIWCHKHRPSIAMVFIASITMTLFLAISTTMICLATSITKLYFCHRYNDGIIDNKFKTEWAYKRRRPRPKLPTAQDWRRLQFESAVDSTKVLIFNTRNGELVQIAKCITPTSLVIWIRSRQYDSSDIQHKKWRVGPDSQVDNTDITCNLNPQSTVR